MNYKRNTLKIKPGEFEMVLYRKLAKTNKYVYAQCTDLLDVGRCQFLYFRRWAIILCFFFYSIGLPITFTLKSHIKVVVISAAELQGNT